MSDTGQAKNTDRDIYIAPYDGDAYYADRIFVTEAGGIGFDVGGYCSIKPLREWVNLAAWRCKAQPRAAVPSDCDHPFCGCDPHAERIMKDLIELGWESDGLSTKFEAAIRKAVAVLNRWLAHQYSNAEQYTAMRDLERELEATLKLTE